MCYFEQTRWNCGYWKWGNFRQQCNKEYRTGETCGLKLVYETHLIPAHCKICEQVTKKSRRMTKMYDDIYRWQCEGNRRATIEKTKDDIKDLDGQIRDLQGTHMERMMSI